MAILVHTFTDGDFPVSLYQHGEDSFKVVYGAHVDNFLNHEEAVKSYGFSVFHSLSCAGLIE